MIVRSAACFFLAAAFTLSAFAAQTNNFVLLSNSGKPIGKASYTIEKAKDGSYKVRSHYQYSASVEAPETLSDGQNNPTCRGGPITSAPNISRSADFTAEYRETAHGDLIAGSTRNSASQLLTSFTPDKTHLTLEVSQMQFGNILGTHAVTMPDPHYIFAPDYDPAALQLLLATALADPHSNGTYTLLVPPSAAFGPNAETQALYVILEPLPAATGTLDGKPVTLRHYLANFHEGHAHLYFDDNLNLMEADIGPLQAKYVREKFVLTSEPAAQ